MAEAAAVAAATAALTTPTADEQNRQRGYGTMSEARTASSTDRGEAGRRRPWLRFSGEQLRLLACLCTGSLMAGCIVALMIPFFPLEASRRGVSQAVTGGVFSCFALTQLLAYPITGRLVPRVGVTRTYNIGLATAGLSTVAFGALAHIEDTDTFVATCFLARVVEALATTALNTSALTVVANRFPQQTNTATSLMETMTGMGICLGPAIGGGLYKLGGYGVPFYVLGALMLAAVCATTALMPSVGEPQKMDRNLRRLLGQFFSSVDNWLCCAVLLTVSMNWTTVDPGIEPYVNAALGITPAQLGLYFLVATGSFCLVGLLWGRVSDLINNTYILTTPCLVCAGIGLLLMPPSPVLGLQPTWWLLGIGMTIKEVFQGGAFIPLFGLILRTCTNAGMEDNLVTQSFLSSVFWTVFSLGNVVGPMSGGAVTDALGFPMMMTLLAAWTFLVATFTGVRALFLCNSDRPRPHRHNQLGA